MDENEKKAIEEMAKVIERTEQIARDAHCGLPSPTMYAKNLYWKGYRKQSEGEWVYEVNHFFDDYGDLKVYVIAHCSECKHPYKDNHSIWIHLFEQPEHEGYCSDWNIDVEWAKKVTLEEAKGIKLTDYFCPNCGAHMKGGAV